MFKLAEYSFDELIGTAPLASWGFVFEGEEIS